MAVLEDRWAFYCDCLAKAGEERVEKILKFHAHLYRDGAVSRPWNLPVDKRSDKLSPENMNAGSEKV